MDSFQFPLDIVFRVLFSISAFNVYLCMIKLEAYTFLLFFFFFFTRCLARTVDQIIFKRTHQHFPNNCNLLNYYLSYSHKKINFTFKLHMQTSRKNVPVIKYKNFIKPLTTLLILFNLVIILKNPMEDEEKWYNTFFIQKEE